MTKTTEILVIGAGAAGLRAACAGAQKGAKVLVVGKGKCISPEIMGFNCVVEKGDTTDCFYEDIIQAGQELNHPGVARVLAENSFSEIRFLESIGLAFDRSSDNSYHALKTLGCRYPRLVHYKALTGAAEVHLMKEYAKSRGVGFEEDVTITDLVSWNGRIAGAVGCKNDSQEFVTYEANAVVLACGGGSAIRKVSTYPIDYCGDGYSIAARVGADLVDMEFQQFEPCAFVYPRELQGRIVPTTLLRAGAKLLNGRKEEFMEGYGLSRDNARKGTLSRAIASEIAAGRGTIYGGVYYDMTMLPKDMIQKGHSIFYNPAKAAGLDITKEMAEMAPAAHTFMGGVKIEPDTSTNIKGLFACGEVAGGVHGADRIGGNAGAEVLVFGNQAGTEAAAFAKTEEKVDQTQFKELAAEYKEYYERYKNKRKGNPVSAIYQGIRDIASDKVGILRNERELMEAQREIIRLEKEFEDAYADHDCDIRDIYACRNMLLFIKMQVEASLLRKESRGVFTRTDYPQKDNLRWKKNIVFYLRNGVLEHKICDVE